MTRNTETIDLQAEADRIDEELDDLAQELAELNHQLEEDEDAEDVSGPDVDLQEKLQESDHLERLLAGVKWAIREWQGLGDCGADLENGGTCQNTAKSCPHHDNADSGVEVVVGGLTTGEYAEVQDRSETLRNQKIGWGEDASVQGMSSIYQAAAGLESAPPLDGRPSFEKKEAFLQDTPPQFKEWLSTKVNEKTTPDVDTGNFDQRLEAAMQEIEETQADGSS